MKNKFMNNQKGIAPIIIALIVAVVLGGGYMVVKQQGSKNSPKVEMPPVTDTGTQQSNQVQQQTNTQTPSTTVTLDLSSSFARQFQTVLTEAFKKSANFNEHYRVAEIGCGTGCFTFVVIDKNTGKVYPAPIGNDIGQFTGNIGQPHSLQSNKIKIIAENGSKINTYTFTGSSFSLLSSENTQSNVSTSNWKTYKNEKYGFEIKYPSNTVIKDIKDKDTLSDQSTLINISFKPADSKGVLMINVRAKENGCYDTALGADPNFIIINGINFVRWDISKYLSTGIGTWGNGEEYCVAYDKLTYSITTEIKYASGSKVPDIETVFNQMVTTFKFTK